MIVDPSVKNKNSLPHHARKNSLARVRREEEEEKKPETRRRSGTRAKTAG